MDIKDEILIPDDLHSAVPLLVALHGGGRDSASQKKLWGCLASREKIILLAPNSVSTNPPTATWFTAGDEQNLATKTQQALDSLPVNRNKIYCFGHSLGASRALLWGFAKRNCIAAIALHEPSNVHEIYNLGSEPGARPLALGIWVGKKEDGYQNSWDVGNKLRDLYKDDRNFGFRLTEIPHYNHNDIYDRPDIVEEIWSFLSCHSREETMC